MYGELLSLLGPELNVRQSRSRAFQASDIKLSTSNLRFAPRPAIRGTALTSCIKLSRRISLLTEGRGQQNDRSCESCKRFGYKFSVAKQLQYACRLGHRGSCAIVVHLHLWDTKRFVQWSALACRCWVSRRSLQRKSSARKGRQCCQTRSLPENQCRSLSFESD